MFGPTFYTWLVWAYFLIQLPVNQMKLLWVPSHLEIQGNEKVDELARNDWSIIGARTSSEHSGMLCQKKRPVALGRGTYKNLVKGAQCEANQYKASNVNISPPFSVKRCRKVEEIGQLRRKPKKCERKHREMPQEYFHYGPVKYIAGQLMRMSRTSSRMVVRLLTGHCGLQRRMRVLEVLQKMWGANSDLPSL